MNNVLASALLEQLTQERELHQQQLSAERERAWKLVHALKVCLQALRVLNAKDYVAYTAGKVALIEYKQNLNDYEKESLPPETTGNQTAC